MRSNINRFLARSLLALALAMPVLITIEMSRAEAHHKNWRRGAVIAGAIIGGAIVYHNYRKHRKYRHHGRYYYHPRKRVRYHRRHHHRGYYHRHHRHGGVHYHRYYRYNYSGNSR